jgi:asparagine synthase (glutamine-hydrolysing)
VPAYRIGNESALAAATAALHPNIDHVIVPNIGRSPTTDLDRDFYLYDQPTGGTSRAGWGYSIDTAVSDHNVGCVLEGDFGNFSLSYDGMELLPESLRTGHWLRLHHEARCLVRSGAMRWRGAARLAIEPWIPGWLWVWAHQVLKREIWTLTDYSGIDPVRFARLDPKATSRHDFSYRRRKDSFALRLGAIRRADPGNFRKGGIAGWQHDSRDPTADVRLVEYCLSVPTDQFLRNGVTRSLARRALADRMPKAVLDERRLGLICADWYEDLEPARNAVSEELTRIANCEMAAGAIDIPRLQALMANWPTENWDRRELEAPYRYVLQRALAIGHFLRRATRSNA